MEIENTLRQELESFSAASLSDVAIYELDDIRKQAAIGIIKSRCLTEDIDENKLILKIAETVLSNPFCLNMEYYHKCETTHCIAGWAAVLNKEVQKIEDVYGTHVAGIVALPSYAKYFFKSNEEAIEMLTEVVENNN